MGVLKNGAVSAFVLIVFTAIAHVASAGECIAVVEGPHDRLIQNREFFYILRPEKSMIYPVKVNNIGRS